VIRRNLGTPYTTRVFNYFLEHALHRFGDLLGHHLSGLNRLVLVRLEQGQRCQLAVVGQGRKGVDQLDSGYGNAIAVRQGRGFRLAPFTVVGQVAHALTREAQAGVLSQAHLGHLAEDRFATNIEGYLAHAHVTGVDQDAGQVEDRTFGARYVTNGVLAQLQGARVDLNLVGRLPAPGFQGRTHGDRLDRGTRLEHVDHGAVAHHRRLQVATVVGVIGGLVDHGQNLAGLHIHDHQAAGLGAVLDQRIAQLAVGQVLQAQVNRQRQGLPCLGVFGHLHVFDQTPAPVLDDLSLARNTGQPLVIGQFDAFPTLVVDIGEADHVRGHFARRVEATELFNAINARHLEVEHDLALLRGQAPDQVDKLFIGLLLQARSEHLGILPKRVRQCRPTVFGNLHFLGIGPQGGHRRTHGQWLAITVGNQASVSRDRDMPQAARIALALEEVMVDHLQINDLARDCAYQQCQQGQHHTKTPRIERAFEFDHGATIRTSAAPGMRIFSCSLARVSIRLWAVQVLCSRINRPHSACALSRTLSSPYRVLSNWRFQWAL